MKMSKTPSTSVTLNDTNYRDLNYTVHYAYEFSLKGLFMPHHM